MDSIIEQEVYASKFINHTNKHVFLTGKAGTGKTTFLQEIVKNTYKKCLIVAPTGIAAINAGGVTIHSLFQLPFGTYVPEKQSTQQFDERLKINDPNSVIKNLQMFSTKRKLLRELELLIIDEVSMLRADLLDAIDVVLRHVKRRNDLPFGGTQVLFIGDLLQLPPVVKNEEWGYLKPYYKSIYFFDAVALKDNKPVYIELNKIYRQTDDRFVEVLNNLRNNTVTKKDTDILNAHYQPEFKPKENDNYIRLTTHNNKADKVNKGLLDDIQEKSYYFDAEIEDDFNEYSYPIEKKLELKLGAQVMFVKNDATGEQRFFNGKIGAISSISNNEIEVDFNDGSPTIKVEQYIWENIKFKLNKTSNEIEENVTGTFKQYPIKLAWAITVHKSQGLTFDKAIIDVGNAFATGQVYVALSRLRSLDGLVLTSPINFGSIGSDSKINSYSKTETEQQNLNTLLSTETYQFLKDYSIKCFQFDVLIKVLEDHTDSYIKDAKKSSKQRHHDWAKEIEKTVKDIKPHADAFKRQINNIIDKKEEGHLDFLLKRVTAATKYFSPIFKELSNKTFRHVEIVKSEKKMKTYVTELLSVEVSINEQNKLINKATLLIQSHIDNKEFTNEDVRKTCFDPQRSEQLDSLYSTKGKRKTSAKKRKPGEPKAEKVDTKKVSFDLYNEGNMLEEIAKKRDMATSTIEGHMAYYIAKGEVEAKQFISEEKIKNIITVSKKLDTLQFGAIKGALGDEYSYGDIKLAMASHLAIEKIPNN